MKIYFFNDTSTGHSGSRAATLAIRSILTQHQICGVHLVGDNSYSLPVLKDSDAVLMNGEGTIHHTKCNHRASYLLHILEEAQRLDKKTLLVNCLLQRVEARWSSVLSRLDFLGVREPHSAREGVRLGGKPLLLADSCMNLPLDGKGKSFANLNGLVVRGFTHPASKFHGILEKHDYIRFGLNSNFNDFVATLRGARAYLTGQHHGVYAAALANVPFVPVPSNTHKIGSLIRWSRCKIPFAKTKSEVKKHIKEIPNRMREFRKFFRWFRRLPVLTKDHINQALSS